VHYEFPGSTCTTAVALKYGEQVNATVDQPGKQFHWRLNVHKGDFLQFATVANPNDQAGMLDTALTLFDVTGQVVRASIDDGYPRHGTDAWLYYRAAATEQLCVRVEDYSSWSHSAPMAFPTMPFTLTVSTMGSSDAGIDADTEPNDTASSAQMCELNQYVGMPGGTVLLYGGLDTATDVDVFRVTAGAGSTQLSFLFPPLGDAPALGVNTCGSTLQRTAAKVTRMDGTVLGALSPPATSPTSMSGSMEVVVEPSADYLVWVERPEGIKAGANDFYTTMVTTSVDNPPEHETQAGQNDTIAAAEPLIIAQMGAKLKAAHILGHISSPSDIDVFSFPANAGDSVALICRAQRAGSGLRGATFVVSSAIATLQAETEGEMRDVNWTGSFGSMHPLPISVTGTYFLKVHAVSQDATNTGSYYRCGVYIQAP
jgi:hypothetical protein